MVALRQVPAVTTLHRAASTAQGVATPQGIALRLAQAARAPHAVLSNKGVENEAIAKRAPRELYRPATAGTQAGTSRLALTPAHELATPERQRQVGFLSCSSETAPHGWAERSRVGNGRNIKALPRW